MKRLIDLLAIFILLLVVILAEWFWHEHAAVSFNWVHAVVIGVGLVLASVFWLVERFDSKKFFT